MHRAAEKAIEASGLAWTFLRPNGFMQNMENYSLPTIKSQSAFYSSVGDSKVAHVDVRDIAAVAVKALTEPGHEGKAYTLTVPPRSATARSRRSSASPRGAPSTMST
jgi:uncharacterized protein YbjT (DUF2867 family)